MGNVYQKYTFTMVHSASTYIERKDLLTTCIHVLVLVLLVGNQIHGHVSMLVFLQWLPQDVYSVGEF